MKKAGIDRLAALHTAIDAVRRGGTISVVGRLRRHGRPAADAGAVRQAACRSAWARPTCKRVGRRDPAAAHRRRRPLGVDDFATHRLPLDEAPGPTPMFQEKQDGAIKVVFRP